MDKAKPFDIPKREIWEAFKKVKANQGAAGVDRQTIADFEADLSNSLYELWNRLSSGSYFPFGGRGGKKSIGFVARLNARDKSSINASFGDGSRPVSRVLTVDPRSIWRTLATGWPSGSRSPSPPRRARRRPFAGIPGHGYEMCLKGPWLALREKITSA